jgi:5-methylcytosine-specific restriction endonuclease McrA
MPKTNLNTKYNYTIKSAYTSKANELVAINSFGNHFIKNWDSKKQGIRNFKKNIRIYLEAKQKERCAYCRQYLQASGKGEHLDHIIAKDTKPQWMFTSINLVLSCSGCNIPKNAALVLNSPYNRRTVNYPDISTAFKIFNPYYDQWSDHFLIDDEVFIQAKPKSKGDFTISTCQLFREQVVINNIRELRMSKSKSKKKIAHRIYKSVKGTEEYQELENVLDQITRTA